MKLLLLTLSLLCCRHKILCQVVPNNVSLASANFAPVSPPIYNGSIKVNYVRTWQPLKEESSVMNISSNTSINECQQATVFFDGLGRQIQTVNRGASPLQNDVVVPIVRDELGREVYKYLPYTSNYSNGNFKINAFTEQSTFMQNNFSSASEQFYYSKNDIESSALNRLQKSMPPGNSWVGNLRGVEMKYWLNTSTDNVRIWKVNSATTSDEFGTYTSPGAYLANQLYKNVTVDEHNKQVIEFSDRSGKKILKKVQLTAASDEGSGNGNTNWLCTYYIYDELDNLRCVIQPKGVELIDGSWSLADQNILDEQCFRYEYDAKRRLILKKVPGAAPVIFLYDQRDRLVFTQDGNLKQKSSWLMSLYDRFNRITGTGIVIATKAELQGRLNSSGYFNNETVITQGSTSVTDLVLNTSLTGSHNIKASNSIMLNVGFETSNPNITLEILNTSGAPSSIEVFGNPLPPGIPYTALTINYYDNYNFTQKVYDNSNIGKLIPGANIGAEAAATIPSSFVNGLATGSKVWVIEDQDNLNTGKWLESVSFYDDKGRIIQSQSENYKGGIESMTNLYDFSGHIICSYAIHNNPYSSIGIQRIRTSYSFDNSGRLKKVEKNINDGNVADKLLFENYYNELGQLKSKKLGADPENQSLPLETLKYEYNIRGWLTAINRDFVNKTTNTGYFGQTLSYDYGFSKDQFNGNISGVKWRSKGDGEQRAYGYDYDAANRLLRADFRQSDVGWSNSSVNFNVLLGDGNNPQTAYDANGNIKKMQHWGLKLGGSSLIDNLTYEYLNNNASNKLKYVTDGVTGDNKLGDFTDKRLGDDYGYDVNGNMITDKNKRIDGNTGLNLPTNTGGIIYNHLNLPCKITVKNDAGGSKGFIKYTYDAVGNKLAKITIEEGVSIAYNSSTFISDVTTSTTYIGGAVYESKAYSNANLSALGYEDVIQFIVHEEGRMRIKTGQASPVTYVYDYFVKDHLGNVRAVLTEEEVVHSYPAATVEGVSGGGSNSMVNHEQRYYNIDMTKITSESDIPSWGQETVANTKAYINNNYPPAYNDRYPSGCTPIETDGSSNLYTLNATANQTGLQFMIKVMAGDKVNILGKSYYLNTSTISDGNSTPLDLLTLMTSLLNSPANAAASKGISASQLESLNTGLIPTQFFTGNNGESNGTVPKAFINYILFDEQFKYIDGHPSRVGISGVVTNHWSGDPGLVNIPVTKNGYLFVYVSNESNMNVYFDNLQVVHKPGRLLEETHYYPFGLTMAGISYNAAGGIENKRKFNKGSEIQNKEFSDGSGLELYATNFRSLDPQLGRWWQIDPKPDYAQSLYSAMGNNPMLLNDPFGDTVRVNKSITENKLLNSSFNAFAATKDGRKFLGNYAAKGQKIGGILFNKDGKYSKKGVDLNYTGESFEKGKGGETGKMINHGRAQIDISLNTNFYGNIMNELLSTAFNSVITIFHESFIHADLYTKDYLDDGQFNFSNISERVKSAASYDVHYQHYKVLMDYMKNGYMTNNLWPGSAFNGLKQLNDIYKIYPSDQKLLNEMWNYNGGIQLDENGNVKNR